MFATSPLDLPRVLLVDGDFRSSQRLARMLEEDGFAVDVAGDGTAAVDRLAQQPPPNILITELQVPLANGLTIARLGRFQNPELQIVVLTRYANRPLPSTFGSRPPVVLSKPLDYGHLMEVLAGASPAVNDL